MLEGPTVAGRDVKRRGHAGRGEVRVGALKRSGRAVKRKVGRREAERRRAGRNVKRRGGDPSLSGDVRAERWAGRGGAGRGDARVGYEREELVENVGRGLDEGWAGREAPGQSPMAPPDC